MLVFQLLLILEIISTLNRIVLLLLKIFLKLVHLSFERLSEVFEGDDNDCDVVKTAFCNR